MHKDRGRVLLAVRVHSVGWTVFLWAIEILWLGLLVFSILKRNRLDPLVQVLPNLLTFVVMIFGYLLHPRIKFFEAGVEIPPTRDQKGPRYLRWDQVERSSWDGDRLVLTGTNSMLAGGPVQGGTVRIPSGQHLAVDQVLGTKLPRTALPAR
jgi:hypothetical protein